VSPRLTNDTLADIQRFITSGYGHLPLTTYIFLYLHQATGAQTWLSKLLPALTSAASWPVTTAGEKIKPSSAVNVAISRPGLAALGLPESVQRTFPVEFQDGMATPERSAILGDTEESAPHNWELGGPASPPIHVVLIVHGESSAEIERQSRAQRALIDDTAGAVTEVQGSAQNGHRPEGGYEPFGFHDGISQPQIRGIAGDGVPTGEFILGYQNHYGIVPPTPVVPEEIEGSSVLPPLANPYHEAKHLRDLGLNGSFVVYRKLQQDVAGFWQFMKREAVRATGSEDAAAAVWLASRAVGRWPSGAPLLLAREHDDPRLGERNDFMFGGDPDGLACPIGAHLRRAHPRDVLKPYSTKQSLSMTEAHRLLRRGRAFGPPLFDPLILRDPSSPPNAAALLNLADDGASRGVHFFCVNASIKSQFEFVQQTWCNNPRFGGLNDNKDPIIGDNARSDQPSSHMTIPYRPVGRRTAAVPRFVTVRGGAYFFMPSITALRFLSAFST